MEVLKMRKEKEKPERKRERFRSEELKRQSSSIHGSNLSDLVGSMSWKSMGLLVLIIIVFFVVLKLML